MDSQYVALIKDEIFDQLIQIHPEIIQSGKLTTMAMRDITYAFQCMFTFLKWRDGGCIVTTPRVQKIMVEGIIDVLTTAYEQQHSARELTPRQVVSLAVGTIEFDRVTQRVASLHEDPPASVNGPLIPHTSMEELDGGRRRRRQHRGRRSRRRHYGRR